MTLPDENETNPYRAPKTPVGSPVRTEPSAVDTQMIKKFREQIVALGALWIIMGCGAFGVAGFALAGNQNPAAAPNGELPVLMIVVGALGLTWLVLGVLSCMKQIWPVYAGLTLSYLSLIGNLFSINVCAIIILALVIAQAHRVIVWANKLRAAGLPLTAKP
jgi:hypothetical protein